MPDGKAYPDEKGVIVTLARFQGERDTLFAHRALVGVRLASNENPAVLKADHHRLAVVVLGVSEIPRRPRVFVGADAAHTVWIQRRNPRDRRFPA
ncbi:MAG: hypothetical protein WDM89_20565 [Rhizomicrobium sp.]